MLCLSGESAPTSCFAHPALFVFLSSSISFLLGVTLPPILHEALWCIQRVLWLPLTFPPRWRIFPAKSLVPYLHLYGMFVISCTFCPQGHAKLPELHAIVWLILFLSCDKPGRCSPSDSIPAAGMNFTFEDYFQ